MIDEPVGTANRRAAKDRDQVIHRPGDEGMKYAYPGTSPNGLDLAKRRRYLEVRIPFG